MMDEWLDRLVEHHFRLLMLLVLLTGICLLMVSHGWLCPGTLWYELVRDLGMATVVSFAVTIVIEYYSAKRREADIRSGVLDAILRKVIHPEL